MARAKQLILDIQKELIVDLFAGGGGMSTAFETTLGRSPDIAINHNEDALSMHRMNHPQTRHFIADVYEVDPKGATKGRPVGWLHLSPDCTHHSQAAGGQPRSKKIRGLSWVGYRWAGQVSPRVISLENVPQILKWGPLVAKRDKETGRVVTLDMVECHKTGKMINRIAEPGERVPVQRQYLVPDQKREGQTWRRFVRALEGLGYEVKVDVSVAADLGGHTTRKRLFLIARRDGAPIAIPERTHAKNPAKGQGKWKSAAECIDWSVPCPSIFERAKPLADATLRRIARGVFQYVLNNPNPFIVPIAHYNGRDTAYSAVEPLRTITAATKGGEFALAAPTIVPATHQGDNRVHELREPLRTVTGANRGELMLSAPMMVQAAHGDGQPGRAQRWGTGSRAITEPVGTVTGSGGHALAAATLVQTGYGERDGQAPRSLDIESPLGTVVAGGQKHAVTTAYLAQMNGGYNVVDGRGADEPLSTITNSGSQQQLVTAHLATLRQNGNGRGANEPLATVTAGGEHHAVVSAFMSNYYTDESSRCRSFDDPTATITTENRIGLVECKLSKEDEAGALRVAAFLMRYHGQGGQWIGCDDPFSTMTTKDRLALVTVMYKGTPHVITDIGLRMLQPRELYRGQDFPESYIIDRGHDGRKFSKSAQVRMVGNSVDPVQAGAYIQANAADMMVARRRAA